MFTLKANALFCIIFLLSFTKTVCMSEKRKKKETKKERPSPKYSHTNIHCFIMAISGDGLGACVWCAFSQH